MNLGLDKSREHVLLRGYPGGNLEKNKKCGLDYVKLCKPEIIVLQIGSNDLCNSTNSVQDVARGIIEVAMKLRFCLEVKKVIICQILHRLSPQKRIRYKVDIKWFNKRCDELNSFLSHYFRENRMDNVSFWKHSGFWSERSKQFAFCNDGVHLNINTGYPKYYNSIRAAVVSARKS
ncbi:unnamed protein product [Mytilus coruscus]|uniref:SGNH hydrolase-type esterase domain-containing protein n=1 Tax=Mytilus coruscus TaxID=42192 RepID=A0A6J8B4X5_MYTCO|nr:unnamed protein product [Mytilus coruscus]